MLELLAPGPGDVALDVGLGSGYHAALLSQLVAFVYGIERIAPLAARARTALARLGVQNVQVEVGDGTRGLPQHAPFDVINIAAAAVDVPGALLDQLAPGGRLVAPIGESNEQRLLRVRRNLTGELQRELLEPVRFVPLLSEASGARSRRS
jgi:protein-L-isoaspartate(D-aspartate) O-methyltransferase